MSYWGDILKYFRTRTPPDRAVLVLDSTVLSSTSTISAKDLNNFEVYLSLYCTLKEPGRGFKPRSSVSERCCDAKAFIEMKA